MAIAVGDELPEAKLIKMGASGPETVDLNTLCADSKIVIFAVPGAFTPTCHSAHMPSFVRTADAIRAKGVKAIVCISVNDAFVMDLWGRQTGAIAAGIEVLADADGAYTRAIGMDFSAAPVGLIGRSIRYSMVVENGIVILINTEEKRGVCETTAGETLLAQI